MIFLLFFLNNTEFFESFLELSDSVLSYLTKNNADFCNNIQKALLSEQGRYLWYFCFAASPEVNNSFIIEGFHEEEGNGQSENSHNAEKLNAQIHSHKCDNGMHTHIHWNKLGFKNLADNGDCGIKHKNTDTESEIAREKADYCPGYHYRARAEDGENINKSGYNGNRYNVSAVINADKFQNIKTDCNFTEGYEYNGCIGLNHFNQNVTEKLFGFYKRCLVGF